MTPEETVTSILENLTDEELTESLKYATLPALIEFIMQEIELRERIKDAWRHHMGATHGNN